MPASKAWAWGLTLAAAIVSHALIIGLQLTLGILGLFSVAGIVRSLVGKDGGKSRLAKLVR